MRRPVPSLGPRRCKHQMATLLYFSLQRFVSQWPTAAKDFLTQFWMNEGGRRCFSEVHCVKEQARTWKCSAVGGWWCRSQPAGRVGVWVTLVHCNALGCSSAKQCTGTRPLARPRMQWERVAGKEVWVKLMHSQLSPHLHTASKTFPSPIGPEICHHI